MTTSRAVSTVTRRVVTSMRTRSRMITSRDVVTATMKGKVRMVATGTATTGMESSSIMMVTIRNDKTTTTCGDLSHRYVLGP